MNKFDEGGKNKLQGQEDRLYALADKFGSSKDRKARQSRQQNEDNKKALARHSSQASDLQAAKDKLEADLEVTRSFTRDIIDLLIWVEL